jgi:hypothetical protein
MNDLERIIMEDIADLDDLRLVDVIGFIRYLKGERPVRQDWITDWYESAIEAIQKRESEFGITPEAIESRIRKLRGK